VVRVREWWHYFPRKVPGEEQSKRTDQGIEQSKRTALKLTRQRTSRTSKEVSGRVYLSSMVTRLRREESSSTSHGIARPDEVSTTSRLYGARAHVTVTTQTQAYSYILCSLSVLKTDHPHVPQEHRRPHVEPFAAHPLTDGTSLIPRDALLDAMEDDDDFEWPEDPFDRPHRAEPESSDELLAIIPFGNS
jgi:hypothetical protein